MMKALSTSNDPPSGASRPFDAKRDGFVSSEGAAVFIIEALEHAQRRGAPILAELAGYGCTSDAHHVVVPVEDGETTAACMTLALADAGLRPEDVDHVNAHATSTQMNDKYETIALKRALGEVAYQIPISATKSLIGHTLGASAAIESVACVQAIRTGWVHPTINQEFPDPDCDLDYVPNKARQADVKVVLKNSFGFGGQNACLVFRKFEALVRVLVAGGAGFIGSSLTNVLLEEQHEVTVLDNLSKGFRTLVPDGARFIEGDLRDEERLVGWLRGHDAVINMAAFIEVGRSVQEPVLFAENNIINSVRLLEAMHKADVRQDRLLVQRDGVRHAAAPADPRRGSAGRAVEPVRRIEGVDGGVRRDVQLAVRDGRDHPALLQPVRPERAARAGDARHPELHQVRAGEDSRSRSTGRASRSATSSTSRTSRGRTLRCWGSPGSATSTSARRPARR